MVTTAKDSLENRAALEAAVLGALMSKAMRFSEMGRYIRVDLHYTMRQLDRTLQRLRKAGKIEFRTGDGWRLCDPRSKQTPP